MTEVDALIKVHGTHERACDKCLLIAEIKRLQELEQRRYTPPCPSAKPDTLEKCWDLIEYLDVEIGGAVEDYLREKRKPRYSTVTVDEALQLAEQPSTDPHPAHSVVRALAAEVMRLRAELADAADIIGLIRGGDFLRVKKDVEASQAHMDRSDAHTDLFCRLELAQAEVRRLRAENAALREGNLSLQQVPSYSTAAADAFVAWVMTDPDESDWTEEWREVFTALRDSREPKL